jgi:hypothetical protein
MLKITSIAIGLLTAISMASGAQAMPREIYSPSVQPSNHAEVYTNHGSNSERHGRQEVNYRRNGVSERSEGRNRRYHSQRNNSRVVYSSHRSESHRNHGRHHSRNHGSVRYYR